MLTFIGLLLFTLIIVIIVVIKDAQYFAEVMRNDTEEITDVRNIDD